MQRRLQRETVRDRLGSLLRKARGAVDTKSVRWLARRSGVGYTTLARLLLDSYSLPTSTPRRRTIDRVALVFGANSEWLATGQGVEQRSLWPALLPDAADADLSDPTPQVRRLFEEVQGLPEPARNRAYRAAVAAVIETVSSHGHGLSHEVYGCLMLLDSLLSEPRRRQVG
jgi:transcriptional regulator with XRE-family HTH domain